jgi:hypothetical protein
MIGQYYAFYLYTDVSAEISVNWCCLFSKPLVEDPAGSAIYKEDGSGSDAKYTRSETSPYYWIRTS